MGQRKGQTGNPNGRPKGRPNKLTSELREVLSEVLGKEITPRKLNALLRSLEPAQRLNALTKLLEFTIPKLQSVDIKAQTEAEFEALERLMETAPEEVFERLEQKIENLNNSKK